MIHPLLFLAAVASTTPAWAFETCKTPNIPRIAVSEIVDKPPFYVLRCPSEGSCAYRTLISEDPQVVCLTPEMRKATEE